MSCFLTMFPQSLQSWDVQKNHPPPPPTTTHAVHPTAGQEKMNFHHEQTHTVDDPKGRIETTKDCNCLDPHIFERCKPPFRYPNLHWPWYTDYKHYLHSCIWNVQVKKIERVANSETGYNSLAGLFPIELHLLNLSPGWIDQCNNDYYTFAFHRKRPSPASV